MERKSSFLCVIIILLLIPLTGCTSKDFSDNTSQTISISGVGNVKIINDLNNAINLDVSGIDNNITITQETNLVRVTMSGTNNVIHVSRHHSFIQEISGIENQIVFYD